MNTILLYTPGSRIPVASGHLLKANEQEPECNQVHECQSETLYLPLQVALVSAQD